MQFQIIGRPNAQQIAEKSGIIEVQLRRFDQALVEIPGVRLQQENDVACTQQREPALDRYRGDADVARQGIHVQDLTATSRRQAQESLKSLKVADIDQLAHIALQVTLRILRIPVGRLDAAVINRRVAAAEDMVEGIPRGIRDIRSLIANPENIMIRLPIQLTERHRQKFQRGTASGKGLADGLLQMKVLRSRKNEFAHPLMFIHKRHDVAEQIRDALDFVKDHRFVELREETVGVFNGELPSLRFFQIGVCIIGKQITAQGRLSGLTRTGDRNSGILCRGLKNLIRHLTGNHTLPPSELLLR